MICILIHECEKLFRNLPGRVQFGFVGDYVRYLSATSADQDEKGTLEPMQSARTSLVGTFGANENNWNLKDDQQIQGSGQAACFAKEAHRTWSVPAMPGVYPEEGVNEVDSTFERRARLHGRLNSLVATTHPNRLH